MTTLAECEVTARALIDAFKVGRQWSAPLAGSSERNQ
jgi:hypothetical protein